MHTKASGTSSRTGYLIYTPDSLHHIFLTNSDRLEFGNAPNLRQIDLHANDLICAEGVAVQAWLEE